VIFKRRVRLNPFERVFAAMAPKKGWRRGFTYIGRRVQRLPDTPHRIAIGFACGVFASFTPFFTLHFIVAALCALVVRGNVLASALGTFCGNPLTFPLIAWASLELGGLILGGDHDAATFDVAAVFKDVWSFLDTLFLPYLVGGIAPGLVVSAAVYALVRPLVAAYQGRRRSRLMAAAKARVSAHLGAIKRPPVVDPAE